MHKQLRCPKTAATLCFELGEGDGIDLRYLTTKNASQKNSRKALQLSKEALRIVSLVLAGEIRHPLLTDLQVVSVQPEQNGLSLRVSLGLYASDSQVTEIDVLAALKPIKGQIRTALAQALHRKRTPMLSFRYVGVIGKGENTCP